MNAVFYDEQNTPNPLNGTTVIDRAELFNVLLNLPETEPFFCKLEGANGYELLFGVGQEYGCAQYSRKDGEPPYLVAVATRTADETECLDFRFGNELTSVPKSRCLPIETVREIAAYFVETGNRSSITSWEEA